MYQKASNCNMSQAYLTIFTTTIVENESNLFEMNNCCIDKVFQFAIK